MAYRVREILDQFAELSGLHINYGKSTLTPIHTADSIVGQCAQTLGCTIGEFSQSYLGLPLSIYKLPISAFMVYIQKADKFLSSWQADLLNPMGRSVLVNSVLDSLLVYLMSSLQIPAATIELMDKTRRAFLWSADKNGKSSPAACLVAWLKVCSPKEQGGLDIRDLGIQNICLLLKLIHRLHCPQSSAWATWVQGCASLVTLSGDLVGDHWKTLQDLLLLYQAITSVVLGDGRNCSFWFDVWLGNECMAERFPELLTHCTDSSTSMTL